LLNGLHRSSLHIESIVPFNAPYFSNAWYEYSEQLGMKRQDGGRKGDIIF
jgi:hypothetical protein